MTIDKIIADLENALDACDEMLRHYRWLLTTTQGRKKAEMSAGEVKRAIDRKLGERHAYSRMIWKLEESRDADPT